MILYLLKYHTSPLILIGRSKLPLANVNVALANGNSLLALFAT